MPETALRYFEDRERPGNWRVEWFDGDGRLRGSDRGTIFSGPNAQERAIRYALGQYQSFEVIRLRLSPCP
jgi:hypothetical protein